MARGVQYPIGADGKRSTTKIGRKIIEAAAAAVDSPLAQAMQSTPKWHRNYKTALENLTAKGLETPANAIEIAKAGLAAAYDQFTFETDSGTQTLTAAMQQPTTTFFTGCIQGQGQPQSLQIPYKGTVLDGAALRQQLSDWQQRNVVEPSFVEAMQTVQQNPTWLSNPGRVHVMLGAGSELGPYEMLLKWGATVIAVDLDRADIWHRLIKIARASAGKLIFPLKIDQTTTLDDAQLAASAGADLLTQAPAIAAWLNRQDGPLTIGCYAYLDGGDHVRVVMAMDAIANAVAQHHPQTALAFLLTPTDVYGVPAVARQEAEAAHKGSTVGKIGRILSFKRGFKPGIRQTVGEYGVVNTLLTEQGFNYALAKRLQRWRAVLAQADGVLVSCNVAPATFTKSVTKRKIFAIVYRGAGNFNIEVFYPDTTRALNAALLIHDLQGDRQAVGHPMELFMQGVNHGGFWRHPHQASSVLPLAVVIGLFKREQVY